MADRTHVTVVIMTRNRVEELLTTLARLTASVPAPPIIVVDNGSVDGTADRVRADFPGVEVIRLEENLGVEARNIAVGRAGTQIIAFNDDDSWWEPDSLDLAVELFASHPRLGALTADVVVQPGDREDPTSVEMRDSPVSGDPALPGIPVLGFLACATAVRRAAFEEVGGFESRLHFGGEEELLATDLAARGWAVRYVPELRVHHQASTIRDHAWRRRRGIRNTLWFLWLRRPAKVARRRSRQLLRDARTPDAARALVEAVLRGGWVLRERRVVPPDVEENLVRLDDGQTRTTARQYRT